MTTLSRLKHSVASSLASRVAGSAPVIRLNSGVTVANFSSPHAFYFNTGEVLPACSPERAKALMLESVEEETIHPKGWVDIDLVFKMSNVVLEELCDMAEDDFADIDVILVPFPVMTAAKAHLAAHGFSPSRLFNAMKKLRVVRTADRVTKTIYSDRFCR